MISYWSSIVGEVIRFSQKDSSVLKKLSVKVYSWSLTPFLIGVVALKNYFFLIVWPNVPKGQDHPQLRRTGIYTYKSIGNV